MSFATVGDLPVIELKLSLPRVGVWHAEATLDPEGATSALSGRVDIVVTGDTEQLSMTGHVAHAGLWTDTMLVNIFGGAGSLGVEAPKKGYRQATFRSILEDLLGAAGEAASSTISQGLLGTSVERWVLAGGRTCGAAIDHLVDAHVANGAWRFLSDGTFWCGTEKYKASASAVEVLRAAPHQAFYELATPDRLWLPGDSVDDLEFPKLSYISHTIVDGVLRSTVHSERA